MERYLLFYSLITFLFSFSSRHDTPSNLHIRIRPAHIFRMNQPNEGPMIESETIVPRS